MRTPFCFVLPCTLAALLVTAVPAEEDSREAKWRVTDTLEVDQVPSWFPVRFSLLTHGQRQYVAYYNAEHDMMVAARRLDERRWQKAKLPSRIGWDSHNYVTMAVDAKGQLHLAGNMHCVPLIYFRTERAGDITSFKRQTMTGEDEHRCTYPVFLRDAEEQLLFSYRSGGSGNGRRLLNVYSPEKQRWRRFLETPMFDGENERNAYPTRPVKGPDGWFHVVWVWRDTPDCATNNNLSYVCSPDMKRWQAADGTAVTLPITLDQTAACVDPVPSGGGIINGCARLAFDSQGRPMISYHKSDSHGNMQVFVARFEDGRWRIRPVTTWDRRVAFAGRGAMPFIGIRISGLERLNKNRLYLSYHHRDFGRGVILLDEPTLAAVGNDRGTPVGEHTRTPVGENTVIRPVYPPEVTEPRLSFPGIGARTAADQGRAEPLPAHAAPHPTARQYILRWETLDAHHDRPRQPPLPPPSTLELITLEQAE